MGFPKTEECSSFDKLVAYEPQFIAPVKEAQHVEKLLNDSIHELEFKETHIVSWSSTYSLHVT